MSSLRMQKRLFYGKNLVLTNPFFGESSTIVGFIPPSGGGLEDNDLNSLEDNVLNPLTDGSAPPPPGSYVPTFYFLGF